MTREEKASIIEELREKFSNFNYFYVTDASGMSVAQINDFRRACFEKGIEYKVYKNTLVKKALEDQETDYSEFDDVLKGFSGIMFSPEAGNVPAKLLKDFYKKNGKLEKPVLKAASIDQALYIGANQLDALTSVKSKQELIADVVALLQSPMKTVLSGLTGSGQKIVGILKTLSEKES
ncbi:large subunit ribosomal protein L10 [Catalinimonas alkaloidigena]|uniref:Large ribosomal subunit protein uL10 n=1 Tax=Catalinimonas alkaloidigena TaxID=1075417 RepID=A0A1G9Q8U6_9BACT|nr:50S ribosomal protein L10 [Catalinimonas alkaloidigena]SDM07380.1 large subunit ribosomal protein L10 [Catalinimonas alkaloidigena]